MREQLAEHIAVCWMAKASATSQPSSTQHNNIADHQRIHLRAQKAVERLLRLTDDRLVFVERGVEHHRHASEVPEAFDEAIVARVGVATDGLQPSRSVDMRDGRNLRPLFLADLEDLH